MTDVEACLSCDLNTGRVELPGGLIHEAKGWRVEHCVGPLGVGTLIVRPERHTTALADLTDDEAAGFGPLLKKSAAVAQQLTSADQVYTCLWSHAGGQPVHIHFVVQPVTAELMAEYGGAYGPQLQMAMFERGSLPDRAAVESFADKARAAFRS